MATELSDLRSTQSNPVKVPKRKSSKTAQVMLLLGNPTLKLRDIAETVGVSYQRVKQISAECRPAMTPQAQLLNQYSKEVLKHLPIAARVRTLVDVATQREKPHAALAAIERADLLNGIDLRPKPEEKHVESARPIFNIAGNLSVSLGLTPISNATPTSCGFADLTHPDNNPADEK